MKLTTNSNLIDVDGIHAVDLGDGVRVPEHVTIHAEPGEDDDLPYAVDLEVVVRDGRLVCETLALHALEGGEPVTTEGLRRVPVTGIMRHGLVGHVYEPVPGEPAKFTTFAPDPEIARNGPTEEALRAAAVIYRLAYALGEGPTKAVASALELTHSTAARWVATARDRGYLGPTTQGRAGGVEGTITQTAPAFTQSTETTVADPSEEQ